MTAGTRLIPQGAQRTARRNAYESVAADRSRARDRAEVGAALDHTASAASVAADTA